MITLWRWANDANVANVAQCAMCNAKVANVANVANDANNVAQQQKRRGDNPEISGVPPDCLPWLSGPHLRPHLGHI